jgi:hypothetical protein
VCIKYNKKNHFTRKYSIVQGKSLKFKNRAQNKGILKDNNQIKGIRECLIKYFTFYYNSTCTVYKDTKYNTG